MKARLSGVAAAFAFFGMASPVYAQTGDPLGTFTKELGPNIVALAAVIGIIWLVVNFFSRKNARAERERLLNAFRKMIEPIAAEYPFIF